MNERIGELLVKENLLSSEQLGKARKEAASKGVRLGAQITELGFLEVIHMDGGMRGWNAAKLPVVK